MAAEKTKPSHIMYTGLTAEQVEKNRRKYGNNILTSPEREPWWKLLLSKFDDPIIRILMIAALVAIAVGTINGEYHEGIGIVVAILLATLLAFANEYKAGKEFDILNKVSDEILIKVIRDSNFTRIPLKDIVFGDILIIEPGEEIPADGKILKAVSLQIDEAKFTGEPLPVEKLSSDLIKDASESSSDTAYPKDVVLRGTMVADGHGVVEVTAVGDNTEIGKASIAATEETHEETPLNRQLDKLSKLIGVAGFGIALLTFLALVFRDYKSGDIALANYQWGFSFITFASLAIALSKVWVPIIGDGFELMGRDLPLPKIIESNSFKSWGLVIAAAGVFFVVCILTGNLSGYLPENPSEWLDPQAVTDFVKFFMIAVTLIVVAVPEGLPMSVTLSLAYSMRRMTASNNLVRRMHACETIGAATVICSDKTGTLTQNKMVLDSTYFEALEIQNLKGRLETDVEKIVAEAIAANSTANLGRKPDGESEIIGNPTEGAILMWLENSGLDYIPIRHDFFIEKQWTFTTERKMMGTLGISGLGKERILYVKGAPEIIFSRCSEVLTKNGIEPIKTVKSKVEKGLEAAQRKGMRTLGFAFKRDVKSDDVDKDIVEFANEMVWLGYISIADPIRPDVPTALEACREAGVDVKMITGDNSNTAWEIGKQAGLINENDNRDKCHITGREFELLSDAQAMKIIRDIKILSRARPADKMRMVKLLQKSGEVVAVTGDGTNDAPALNHANVGLAMGKTGSSVAKEASDIILLDDSFPTVVKGIMWGRSLYDNIQRFVMFQLTINVVALGVALTGPFIGVKMPLTVIQMLWVNLIMDTFAALALATEPPHWEVMERRPRKPEAFLVTKPMYRHIFGVGGVFYILSISMLLYMQKDGIVDTWELSVFFTTFVMLQFWNMFNARTLGLNESAFHEITKNKGFSFIVPAIFIIQVLIIQFGNKMFRTKPLSLKVWLTIIVSTSLVLWIGEIYRYICKDKTLTEKKSKKLVDM